jgi:hypothetical protein
MILTYNLSYPSIGITKQGKNSVQVDCKYMSLQPLTILIIRPTFQSQIRWILKIMAQKIGLVLKYVKGCKLFADRL